jgi:hypothetical protein
MAFHPQPGSLAVRKPVHLPFHAFTKQNFNVFFPQQSLDS